MKESQLPQRESANVMTRVSAIGPGSHAGRRTWAAERLIELAPLVRNRLRRRLQGNARRLFDSQDIMSTVLRRIDRLAAEGRLQATTDEELIVLLIRVSDRVIVDRYRVLSKLRRAEGEDSHWARSMLQKLEAVGEDEGSAVLAEVYQTLANDEERQLLSLWLRDLPHTIIAQTLGISPETSRQRWVTLRRKLESHRT